MSLHPLDWRLVAAFVVVTFAALVATAWPWFRGDTYRRLDRIAAALVGPAWAMFAVVAALVVAVRITHSAALYDECLRDLPRYACERIVYSGRAR